MQRATDQAAQIGGFIAAEGSFIGSHATATSRFTFAVALGGTDAAACEWLAAFFDCGTVHHFARRRPHYDDEVRFQVRKLSDLVEVIVPFMDEHLPPSYKRRQFLVWRLDVLDRWQHAPRRRHDGDG